MDPRLRGDDVAAQISTGSPIFFTRSNAGIHFRIWNKILVCSPPSRQGANLTLDRVLNWESPLTLSLSPWERER